MLQINDFGKELHDLAIEKGWWDKPRPIPELLCLLHSEISEALEAYREDDVHQFGIELADLLIRLLEMCDNLKIDLEAFVEEKHEINKGRSYRHGNKKC